MPRTDGGRSRRPPLRPRDSRCNQSYKPDITPVSTTVTKRKLPRTDGTGIEVKLGRKESRTGKPSGGPPLYPRLEAHRAGTEGNRQGEGRGPHPAPRAPGRGR